MSDFPQYPATPERQPEEPVTDEVATGSEPEATPPAASAGWRHPVDVGHLVMGVAFLLLACVWMLVASEAVEGREVRWLLPVPWIAAGVAGIVASVAKARRSSASMER